VRAKIESIARISPQGEGPPTRHDPSSPVIPPRNPQGMASNNVMSSSKSTAEASLISFEDDSDEFVDARE
jgi:hypothetical protein